VSERTDKFELLGQILWDVRWQCRGCGRFIPRSAIQERDHVDPMAYFGVRSEWWVDCARCGPRQNVICVETKAIAYE